MKKKAKYRKELARAMYSYFSGYSESFGAPSFAKFARSIGVTVRTLEGFRKKREFDEAWRECNEIRRDYLIDSALCKRFDSSFTKFIYALEYSSEAEGKEDAEMRFVLKVLGEEDDL